LDQWTQYLIEDSLIPAFQLSTDDFAGQLTNQTNLAIKGIIGIRCMAEIEKLLGNNAKYANYSVCVLHRNAPLPADAANSLSRPTT
jgi:hypothetical protein